LAKLDDLRAKLRTGKLQAEMEAARDQLNRGYKINGDGSNALIKFGRHRGMTLLQIKQKEPSYLDFIRTSDFPDELKDVVRFIQTSDASKEIAAAASSIAGGPRKMPMIKTSHSSLRGDKKR
jgi:hypothetical protein